MCITDSQHMHGQEIENNTCAFDMMFDQFVGEILVSCLFRCFTERPTVYIPSVDLMMEA
jgi:hypothetical protein